jgi:hypothetical protein
MGETIIESYAKDKLPTAGVAGRLARVTDDAARVWMDDGNRWSPLSGNVVDVRSYGAAGDGKPEHAIQNTTALKAALNTGANVYLPRGTYHINETLPFHSGQMIFGDAKAFGEAGTVIVAIGAFPVLRSADCPALTRDVLIRDLTIDNKTLAQPGSGGIDFTGASLSRIERVSMRWHETGIIGRDSSAVPATTVRAAPKGVVLPVVSTRLFRTDQPIKVTETWPDRVSYSKIIGFAATDSPGHPALILDALPKPVQPGDPVYIEGDVGGYFNSVVDCEIVSCATGLSLTNAGNAWTLLDGHMAGNGIGVRVEHSVGNRVRGTFEGNGVGVLFDTAGSDNVILSGTYFEGNGDPDRWPGHARADLGAVRCRVGATGNVVEPGLFSNGTDTVVQDDAAHNLCTEPNPVAFPAMPSGHGSGRNILFNSDFAVDSQHRRIADGWTFNAPQPSTFTMAIDTSTVPGGASAAQRWSMNTGDNSLRALVRKIAVIPGQWYTFTGRTQVDANGAGLYRLRLAETPAPTQDQQYYYSGSLPQHDYAGGLHRATFQIRANNHTLVLLIENVNTAESGPALCHAPARATPGSPSSNSNPAAACLPNPATAA